MNCTIKVVEICPHNLGLEIHFPNQNSLAIYPFNDLSKLIKLGNEIWKSKVSHNPKIVNVVFLPTMEI
jgi:hypothetical protein